MGLFKREEMPSIGGEIKKLDDKATAKETRDKERSHQEWKNSPDGIRERRMENAVKAVKVKEYTPEELTQAQQELQEAEAGYQKMLSEPATTMWEVQVKTMNSEFWQTKIGVSREKIRQLEALRDLKSAREEVASS